jgi:hypothetical protein
LSLVKKNTIRVQTGPCFSWSIRTVKFHSLSTTTSGLCTTITWRMYMHLCAQSRRRSRHRVWWYGLFLFAMARRESCWDCTVSTTCQWKSGSRGVLFLAHSVVSSVSFRMLPAFEVPSIIVIENVTGRRLTDQEMTAIECNDTQQVLKRWRRQESGQTWGQSLQSSCCIS